MTECNPTEVQLHPVGARDLVARFDGGNITSDAGGILLRELELKTGIIRQFAECFTDYRDAELIEHSVYDLLAQRVYGIALGYEDQNDHDDLRRDPLMAVLVGKADPTGNDRVRARDKGNALAGKSTLNRLELTPAGASEDSRYKKIVASCASIEQVFVKLFLQAHPKPPKRIVLDLDSTNDPVHGDQLGRFFHGYYKEYCFLPLYIFCGEHLLCAALRPADIDASAGALGHLQRIVAAIRAQWPEVKIVVRADSGFCRDHIMNWCEREHVDFLFGLPQNKRLLRIIGLEMHQAKQLSETTGQAARVFKDFTYKTHKTWSRTRRVVGKAEHLTGKANPRFVVTSLSPEEFDAVTLYEKEYCARGEMENRIKEQQLYLFADRTSADTMRANQLRLWLSSIAYTLLATLRQKALAGTEMASARCDTIRLKLLKIGAQVRVTVRKVWLSLSEAYPLRELFERVMANICRLPALPMLC
jgi:Transposase DDE domain group 1